MFSPVLITISVLTAQGWLREVATTSACTYDGIHAEVLKAIELLKIQQQNPKSLASSEVFRQDDDDEDIPFYVPAIGKVIGAVLAQNATSVITESLGFIPPEVNGNVQYVLNLVAETLQNLRPNSGEKSTTASAASANSQLPQTTPDPQAIAELEGLLAFALAQELNKTIQSLPQNENFAFNPQDNSPTFSIPEVHNVIVETPTTPTQEVVVQQQTILQDEVIPQTTRTSPEMFSSTFKYGGLVVPVNLDGTAIYASGHAPNYFETTTEEKIHVYAPAYQSYMTIPPSPQPTEAVITASTNHIVEETTEEIIQTTTDDDDDEYEDENDGKRASF